MDDEQRSCLRELARDPAAGALWRSIAEALEAALEGGDQVALSRAALASARALALVRGTRLAELLDQMQLGLQRLRSCGLGQDGKTFADCQMVLLRAVAEGYAEGLHEIVAGLRRKAEALSPVDPASGVLRPRQTVDHLALELVRCQRMDLPLGVAAVIPADTGEEGAAPRRRAPKRGKTIGRLLHDNLRSYDGVGSLEDGGSVLFLPGVSRDGLLKVMERLHGLFGEDSSTAAGAPSAFVLLHLDCADLSAAEILAAVGDRGRIPSAADYLVWV